MGVLIEEESRKVMFTGVVYESEVVDIRNFLNESAPESVTCDLRECEDLHLAVLQQILSYSLLYKVKYIYGEEDRAFKIMIEGFNKLENSCN